MRLQAVLAGFLVASMVAGCLSPDCPARIEAHWTTPGLYAAVGETGNSTVVDPPPRLSPATIEIDGHDATLVGIERGGEDNATLDARYFMMRLRGDPGGGNPVLSVEVDKGVDRDKLHDEVVAFVAALGIHPAAVESWWIAFEASPHTAGSIPLTHSDQQPLVEFSAPLPLPPRIDEWHATLGDPVETRSGITGSALEVYDGDWALRYHLPTLAWNATTPQGTVGFKVDIKDHATALEPSTYDPRVDGTLQAFIGKTLDTAGLPASTEDWSERWAQC